MITIEETIRSAGRVIGDMSGAQVAWNDVSELSDLDLASNIIFWREHREAITQRKGGGVVELRSLEAEWEKRYPIDVPWVIQGEPGGHTLTKWNGETVEGYQNWCGTCGWHGQVYPTVDEAYAQGNDGTQHYVETGHTAPDDE